MEFFDNNSSLVQFAIVFFAFYVIWQIINKNSQAEHMDETSPPAALSTNNIAPVVPIVPAANFSSNTAPSAVSYATLPPTMSYTDTTSTATATATSILPSIYQPSDKIYNYFNDTTTNSSGSAVHNSQLLAGNVVDSAVSGSVQNTQVLPANIVDSAVPPPPANIGALDQLIGTSSGTANDPFTAQAADFDALFATKTILNPTELIPKTPDTELYAGIVTDPKLNQNFLQNRWSLGIDVSKPKRGYINDLRGQAMNPITVTPIFGQPTIFPDLYNRTLAEIS